jgi:glutamate/tyrosine decarboxylase-like PLP-dependent enzyme
MNDTSDTHMNEGLLSRTLQYALKYQNSVMERPVFPRPEDIMALDGFREEWPDAGYSAISTLDLLHDLGSKGTVATTGGRYFGFVTGGSLPSAMAADWLLTAWDQCASLPVLSPVSAVIEDVAGGWVLEALDLPRDSMVAFPTGASYGNLIALTAARRAQLLAQGYDVDAEGLRNSPPIRVIVSEETHATLIKGLGVLGLGRNCVEIVPTDDQGCMSFKNLPPLDQSCIVCAQAGNVNSGGFDDFSAIAEATNTVGAWLHIDGAFGLWARASGIHSYLAEGAQRAQSWVTDGHKWLNTPYDCGIVIIKDRAMVHDSLGMSTAYLPEDKLIPAKDRLIELSRRARGVTVWAALRSLGRSGLADLIERHCQLAKMMAEGLEKLGFCVHNKVVLNQIVASYGSEARTEAIRSHLIDGGIAWCGPTQWKGHAAFRISISGWATTALDVQKTLEALAKAIKEIDKA